MKSRREAADERRQRRIKVVVSIFLVFLLTFSTIGYYFTSTGTTQNFNGFTIKPVGDASGVIVGYTLKVDKQNIPFYTLPPDTQGIPLPLGIIDTLKASEGIVFLFDPSDNQTIYYDQVRFDFGAAIPDKPQGVAVTVPANATSPYQYQTLSCADATPQYPIILFEHGVRSVTYRDGCFVLQGELQDHLLLRDRLLYAYYGVTTS